MPRFDVYSNPDTESRAGIPYLLDVQNSYLDELVTRVMVPLHVAARFESRVRGLNPLLNVNGKDVVMDTAAIGAVPAAGLRRPLANLSTSQGDILTALDTLFGAY